jgi:23S rRNA pseudouridine1911/1915/1917 synthase
MDKIQVIYEDEYLLVVNKPPGLIVTPSDTIKEEQTLSDILTSDFHISLDRGGVVHRLDKNTSGLLVVAKKQDVLEALQLQFKERMVKKEYVALVHGFLSKEEVVKGSIDRNPRNRERFVVIDGGKEAETKFSPQNHFLMQQETLEQIFSGFNKIQLRKMNNLKYNEFSLVRCFPLTGRTHQIRVHLKHLGFPIVGDEKYVGRRLSRLDYRWCKRQFLHAAKLEFYHPQDGMRMSFESPVPSDLEEVLSNLKPVS